MISHKDGKQTYIFYTIRQSGRNRIGLLEVLINEKLQDDEQLVIDYGELTVPLYDLNNFGLLHLGGGDSKLLTFFDTFDKIKGYTMCSYTETINEVGSSKCYIINEKKNYSIDPFKTAETSCGKR